MSFSELGLSEKIVRAVAEQGYTTPTPIQAQAIPAILKGGDLLAGAQTGTGKTAGFTLPMLQLLSETAARQAGGAQRSGRVAVRALVLTPTRELAAQVEESVRNYGKYLRLRSMVMFGGVGINPQIEQLKRGVEIVVATPGRLLDHVSQRTIDLSQVELLVLDEADRMLDMGFIHDIRKILNVLPAKRQNLLFSATFSDDIRALADRLLNNPASIEVARRNTTAETVDQRVYPVDRERKRELLAHLVRQHDWHQVLVFTRTKHGANRLAEQLTKDGLSALAIHGNKSQSARTRALSEFKAGTLRLLVATDIAARGIDIDQLPHVVNFDLPNVPEDYVHRIGRTGRAGAEGEAISLVCVDELGLLRDIERLIKRKLEQTVLPGFEVDPSIAPEPIQKGRQQRGGGQGQGRGRAEARPAGDGAGAPRQRPARQGQGAPRQGQGQSQSQGQRGNGAANGNRAAQPAGARNPAPRRDGQDPARPQRAAAQPARPPHDAEPAPARNRRAAPQAALLGGSRKPAR
ncbi:DEAD/DEAH box helicase [Cupriavidus taiwanensis]|uniref:ATP-dependent RNA helicase RhlE n=1 Tax=Cupriavidus taiwanensis TaxID=164546 RepID=A0A375GUD7_9BURK|nr:DEAD/DEAH box helicase [Cupriavidus taiwanensis]SOY54589.1 ATP-dependent RNA helicase hydrolase [Cupriavidus taiwanensis]SOY55295.1 ATP-dependent RNA helicase hydrolase [Cupriavidus taiwanensis]SOY89408.1 ATP-dependent RNA helicase hydrolase [Cupriavidus taiwanensis]SOZ24941.1 ATP-dependent RNA helicase hydrolase [Cupriavidus taiwanensis]SOZ61590.1 ATP-dependent RNA helicase hydrolase [Cupriavidus taiwanensis]